VIRGFLVPLVEAAAVESILEYLGHLKNHWNTLALIATWVGILVVWVRRRSAWMRKQFLNQVNFSLNYVAQDSLAMRTLLETTAQQVWLNEYGIKKVFAAAQNAPIDNPFIVLDDQTDHEFVMRAVLNVLSEKFAESYLGAALGLPVQHANFCFALTCEKYDEIRTLKLRVLLIEEQTLVRLFGPDQGAEKLRITEKHYHARLKTLKAMHDLYQRDKGSTRPGLGYMELGIRP
jgi:hypothetical protein